MDLVLPVNSVIDFLLDNIEEERLIHQFLEILKMNKEYNFAIQVFKRQSEVGILESLRTIDSVQEKTVLPSQMNKEMLKIFICQCVGLVVRKISDLLFYCNERPRAYFLERFDSQPLSEIVAFV